MKLQHNFEIEFNDEDILSIINEEQEFENLEGFDTLEEVPEQLIYHYLEESQIFSDIFYDEFRYDGSAIIIIKD
jgi:hypothetical protein